MGTELKVGPKKADVLDGLNDVMAMMAFMDYSTRMAFEAGAIPGDFVLGGICCINRHIEDRLKAITTCIDDSAVFAENI